MPIETAHDETRIRQHLNRLAEAIHAKDLESLRQLYATNVVSFDVEPPLQHVGVEAKLRSWARVFLLFADVAYEVRDLALAVDNEVAFGHCFGRLSGTLQNGAPASGMWVRVTFCFRKLDGTWLIVHDQASVPFDVQTGKGVADLEP